MCGWADCLTGWGDVKKTNLSVDDVVGDQKKGRRAAFFDCEHLLCEVFHTL
jgi:hypothetical protein